MPKCQTCSSLGRDEFVLPLVALGICWTRGLEGVSLRWHDRKNPSNLYAKTDKAPPRKSANPWICRFAKGVNPSDTPGPSEPHDTQTMGTRTSSRASGAVGGNASGAMCQGRGRTNDLRTGQGSGPAEARFTRRPSRKGATCGSRDKPVGMSSREPFSQAGTTTRHLRWLAVPQTARLPYPQ